MEVMVPNNTMTSQTSLHYLSAPSSPKGFGDYNPYPNSDLYYYTSAPTSPSRGEFSFDHAFNFSGQLTPRDVESSQSAVFAAADELFEGGMIRPLIPANYSSRFDPPPSSPPLLNLPKEIRGRSASLSLADANNHRIGTRSLSPIRGNCTEFDHQPAAAAAQTVHGSITRGGGGSKKWRLKDFFLFRSASEGRATGRGSKDPLRKYTLLSSSSSSSSFSPSSSDVKHTDGNRSNRGSLHERHYVKSRAAAEDMRKKTPLPFHRNTLFGYLRSNAAIHSISRRWNGCYSNQNQSR